MRPKSFEFTLSGTDATSVYWPIDTHLAPSFGIGFAQSAGAGTAKTCSASYTQFPILSRGITSASWVQITAVAEAVSFNIQSVDTLTCFRLAVKASGAGTFGFLCNQSGWPMV